MQSTNSNSFTVGPTVAEPCDDKCNFERVAEEIYAHWIDKSGISQTKLKNNINNIGVYIEKIKNYKTLNENEKKEINDLFRQHEFFLSDDLNIEIYEITADGDRYTINGSLETEIQGETNLKDLVTSGMKYLRENVCKKRGDSVANPVYAAGTSATGTPAAVNENRARRLTQVGIRKFHPEHLPPTKPGERHLKFNPYASAPAPASAPAQAEAPGYASSGSMYAAEADFSSIVNPKEREEFKRIQEENRKKQEAINTERREHIEGWGNGGGNNKDQSGGFNVPKNNINYDLLKNVKPLPKLLDDNSEDDKFANVKKLQDEINKSTENFLDSNKFYEELWCAYKKKHVELLTVLSLIGDVMPIVQLVKNMGTPGAKIYYPVRGKDAKNDETNVVFTLNQTGPMGVGLGIGMGMGMAPNNRICPDCNSEITINVNDPTNPLTESGPDGCPNCKEKRYQALIDYLLMLIDNQSKKVGKNQEIYDKFKEEQKDYLKGLLDNDPKKRNQFEELLKQMGGNKSLDEINQIEQMKTLREELNKNKPQIEMFLKLGDEQRYIERNEELKKISQKVGGAGEVIEVNEPHTKIELEGDKVKLLNPPSFPGKYFDENIEEKMESGQLWENVPQNTISGDNLGVVIPIEQFIELSTEEKSKLKTDNIGAGVVKNSDYKMEKNISSDKPLEEQLKGGYSESTKFTIKYKGSRGMKDALNGLIGAEDKSYIQSNIDDKFMSVPNIINSTHFKISGKKGNLSDLTDMIVKFINTTPNSVDKLEFYHTKEYGQKLKDGIICILNDLLQKKLEGRGRVSMDSNPTIPCDSLRGGSSLSKKLNKNVKSKNLRQASGSTNKSKLNNNISQSERYSKILRNRRPRFDKSRSHRLNRFFK
jgi:hypothetical protein